MKGMIVAGGAVSCLLTKNKNINDIDVFLVGSPRRKP